MGSVSKIQSEMALPSRLKWSALLNFNVEIITKALVPPHNGQTKPLCPTRTVFSIKSGRTPPETSIEKYPKSRATRKTIPVSNASCPAFFGVHFFYVLRCFFRKIPILRHFDPLQFFCRFYLHRS